MQPGCFPRTDSPRPAPPEGLPWPLPTQFLLQPLLQAATSFSQPHRPAENSEAEWLFKATWLVNKGAGLWDSSTGAPKRGDLCRPRRTENLRPHKYLARNAHSCTIHNRLKQTKKKAHKYVSIGKRVNKMHAHTMHCPSTIKRDSVLIHAAVWMGLKAWCSVKDQSQRIDRVPWGSTSVKGPESMSVAQG